MFNELLGLQLPNNQTTDEYQPFKNYRHDLKHLLTFKEMISKVVSEFCKFYFS